MENTRDAIEVRINLGWNSGTAIGFFDLHKVAAFVDRDLYAVSITNHELVAVFYNASVPTESLEHTVRSFTKALCPPESGCQVQHRRFCSNELWAPGVCAACRSPTNSFYSTCSICSSKSATR